MAPDGFGGYWLLAALRDIALIALVIVYIVDHA
jgi:hypothetical protein